MKVVEKKARDEMIEEAGETEGARRATGVFPAGAPPAGATPDAEVVAKAERRRFTAEYKRRIVREADRCTKSGEIGALLRREGLYSSHLVTWRAARDRGELEGLSAEEAWTEGGTARSAAEENRRAGARDRAIDQARRASGGAGGAPKKTRNSSGDPAREREVTIETVREAGATLGIAPACAALGLPTATYYRRIGPKPPLEPRPSPPRKLAAPERAAVLEVLHETRFVDLAPPQVFAQLLDEERFLCSERTMYRILEENHEVRERRDQLRHPQYPAPELLATAPNQVWSWDITKLLETSHTAQFQRSVTIHYRWHPCSGDARGQARVHL